MLILLDLDRGDDGDHRLAQHLLEAPAIPALLPPPEVRAVSRSVRDGDVVEPVPTNAGHSAGESADGLLPLRRRRSGASSKGSGGGVQKVQRLTFFW